MSHEAESADLLARAIGEFREELLLWIDTELTRLRGRAAEESPVIEESSTGPDLVHTGQTGEFRFGSPTHIDTQSPGRPESPPGVRRATLRDPEAFADRSAAAETREPQVAFPRPEADPESQAPPLNPRQRLDALAQLLDRRLKQVEGAADPSGSVPGGTRTRLQDESSGPSGRRGAGFDSRPEVNGQVGARLR